MTSASDFQSTVLGIILLPGRALSKIVHPSPFSCMHLYLAIDSSEYYLRTVIIRALITELFDNSQRNRCSTHNVCTDTSVPLLYFGRRIHVILSLKYTCRTIFAVGLSMS